MILNSATLGGARDEAMPSHTPSALSHVCFCGWDGGRRSGSRSTERSEGLWEAGSAKGTEYERAIWMHVSVCECRPTLCVRDSRV